MEFERTIEIDLYALSVLARHVPTYRRKGIDLVHQIRIRCAGERRCLEDEGGLERTLSRLRFRRTRCFRRLSLLSMIGLGMILWLTHFFTGEDWAVAQRRRSLAVLDRMWREDGYFCREPNLPHVKFAFTNYGVSVGLQAVEAMTERVPRLNSFFDHYRSGDEYDREAITHVMACSSHFPGYLIRGLRT